MATLTAHTALGRAGEARPNFVYNFVRIHRTLLVTPAMAAGVTPKLWEVSDIVELLAAEEGKKAA